MSRSGDRVIVAAELATVLALHAAWLKNPSDGKRASLEGANLAGANLDGASLDGASLDGANLDGANLFRARLDRANLDGANLAGAHLAGANLAGANLAGASLDGANLVEANLVEANLGRANLAGAHLAGARLDGANLDGARLAGASLGTLHVMQIGPIGSRGATLVYKWGSELDEAMTGCFRGTLEVLAAAVQAHHGESAHGRAYTHAIAFLRLLRDGVTQGAA